MKNINSLIVLIALAGVSVASAYYDQYGNWHEDIVTEALDVATLGRFSDEPQDTQARKEASRELKDKERKAQQKKRRPKKRISKKISRETRKDSKKKRRSKIEEFINRIN